MSFFFRLFFDEFDFFSIFPKKVIGPDVSEKILGRPGCPGAHLGASEGGPGGLLGGPGALRGGPGGVLGGSWALLGRSWSDLGGSPIADRFFDRF